MKYINKIPFWLLLALIGATVWIIPYCICNVFTNMPNQEAIILKWIFSFAGFSIACLLYFIVLKKSNKTHESIK